MSDLENAPSGWWWNPDISQKDLDSALSTNKARLASLAVRGTNPLHFAAVWVSKNSDEAGAGWTHDTDEKTLRQTLGKTKRLVCLAPYVESGKLHLAAAWVPNSGADAIASDFTSDTDFTTLENTLSAAKSRPIIFRSYMMGGTRHHAAVWVDNSGSHDIKWWMKPDLDVDQLGQQLGGDSGRLTCIDPFVDNGELKFGAVWIKNTGSLGKAYWWYHGLDATTLVNKLDLFCSYLEDLQV
jgi:hypothetical protein